MTQKSKEEKGNQKNIPEATDLADSSIAEWTFESVDDTSTIVTVVSSGYSGATEEEIKLVLNSVKRFSWVLVDLKTLFEQGKSARIVREKAWLIEKSMQ